MFHKDPRINECLVASCEAVKKMILSAKSEYEVMGLVSEFVRCYEDAMESAVDEALDMFKKRLDEEA